MSGPFNGGCDWIAKHRLSDSTNNVSMREDDEVGRVNDGQVSASPLLFPLSPHPLVYEGVGDLKLDE